MAILAAGRGRRGANRGERIPPNWHFCSSPMEADSRHFFVAQFQKLASSRRKIMDEADTTPPKEPILDLEEIRQIVDLMADNDLSYFNLKHGSFKIKLRRGPDMEAAKNLFSAMPMVSGAAAAPAASPS